MKTYLDYINEKTFTFLIIFTMFAIPSFELIGNLFGMKYFFQEQIISILGLINAYIILFHFIKKIFKKQKFNFVLSDFFIILCFVFCIISLIFSNNFYKSFLGEYAYSETIFNVICYFSLFILSTLIKKEENKNKIFKSFIILCIFETLIAFLQNFSIWPISSFFDTSSHINGHFAFGLTQHCNFYAGLSIIFTGISAGAYMYKKEHNNFYLILTCLACFGTLFTYTRIAWVGIFSILFIIGIIEFIITKKKTPVDFSENIKKFLLLIALFIICFLITGISSGQLIRDFNNTKNEFSDFDSIGTNRGRIWKVGLYSLQFDPLTGVGFDDYRHAYELYPTHYDKTQNKGHNEYIHTLVTQGIPSGINYLLFSIYCCLFPLIQLKTSNSNTTTNTLTKIFIIALFAYMVQALFNSSINNVAPYKWILMGLLLPRIDQLYKTKKIITE